MPLFGKRPSSAGVVDAASDAQAAPVDQRNVDAYKDKKGFTTIALHHGHKLDTDNRARAVPIFQTTSFEFKSSQHAASLFGLAELGPIYTRIMNPTTHVFEYKMAELEGAPCKAHGDYNNAATLPNSLAVASGQSAQMHALLTFMQAGDNFIAASELYGGTISQRAPIRHPPHATRHTPHATATRHTPPATRHTPHAAAAAAAAVNAPRAFLLRRSEALLQGHRHRGALLRRDQARADRSPRRREHQVHLHGDARQPVVQRARLRRHRQGATWLGLLRVRVRVGVRVGFRLRRHRQGATRPCCIDACILAAPTTAPHTPLAISLSRYLVPSQIAHDELKVPLVVDNTFGMGGYTCRPLKWGAGYHAPPS